MSTDGAAVRTAIMQWRDDQSLAALRAVHEAALDAMQIVEAQLPSVNLADAMFAAAQKARALIRPAMRNHLGTRLDRLFVDGARALRRIDARLEPIALRHHSLNHRPALPGDARNASHSLALGMRDSLLALAPFERLGTAFAAVIPASVRDLERSVSGRVAHSVGGASGAHARLRAAAADELALAWIGTGQADEQPFLSQLLGSINATADAAKKAIK